MKNQAPSLSWGHNNINVGDLDDSIAFYQKLGFTVPVYSPVMLLCLSIWMQLDLNMHVPKK